jgi:hypothetical protein
MCRRHDADSRRSCKSLFAKLRQKISDAQLVELTATLAWENYRARFDHAFGVEAEGFTWVCFAVNFPQNDETAPLQRRYISSSMNEQATSGGTLGSRWTRGPSFRTGSAP